MIFWKLYDGIEQALALIALIGTVAAVLTAGIGRSIGAPVTSAPQFAQLFLIWTCMLGADLAMKRGEAIRVSALPDLLPPGGRRVLSLVSLVLIMPFLGFLAYLGWDLAIGNWQRELGGSGLSYGLVTLALPVGAVLLALTLMRRVLTLGLNAAFEPVLPDLGALGTDRAPGHAPGLAAGHSSEDLL
ncbi:MAG: TRAP transporter small permease [Limimaricola soesokkakensis]|uniref:TRAP transporter small permease n=1 Tax=Limimaricola soesokkakensis TaxID=1343159 RepID=UPI004058F1AD